VSYCVATAAAVYNNHVQKEQVETVACKRDNYATTVQQPKGGGEVGRNALRQSSLSPLLSKRANRQFHHQFDRNFLASVCTGIFLFLGFFWLHAAV
jgi:hypothetical protein